MKTCSRCGKRFEVRSKWDTYCKPCNALRQKEYRSKNRERTREQGRLQQLKYRSDPLKRERIRSLDKTRKLESNYRILQEYGTSCVCCKVDYKEFLVLDHINNDGSEHRRELESITTNMKLWAKNNGYPELFQVLCWNCNFNKWRDGICFHQSGMVERDLSHTSKVNQRLTQLRLEVLSHYGKICICCGETYEGFLVLKADEIKNMGRRKFGWLKRHNYSTLCEIYCQNCDRAKMYYNNCPHQTEMAVLYETQNN